MTEKINKLRFKLRFASFHIILLLVYYIFAGTTLSIAISAYTALEMGVIYFASYRNYIKNVDVIEGEFKLKNYIFYGLMSMLHFVAAGLIIYFAVKGPAKIAIGIGFIDCVFWTIIFFFGYLALRNEYKRLMNEIDK